MSARFLIEIIKFKTTIIISVFMEAGESNILTTFNPTMLHFGSLDLFCELLRKHIYTYLMVSDHYDCNGETTKHLCTKNKQRKQHKRRRTDPFL